jgi:hypothetical protein
MSDNAGRNTLLYGVCTDEGFRLKTCRPTSAFLAEPHKGVGRMAWDDGISSGENFLTLPFTFVFSLPCRLLQIRGQPGLWANFGLYYFFFPPRTPLPSIDVP